MSVKPRVFISYSRKDGEQYAKKLRRSLIKENIPLWQDRIGMEGGRDWWLQIVEALNQVEYMVLVFTPGALKSPIIRKEWRYARQNGVGVYPVKGVADSDLDYGSLPRWMRSVHFYDIENEWTKFINDLNTRCETPRVPFMVDDLPEDFVSRPKEFNRLVNQLLSINREEPMAITAAFRGAGGYGKTTLVQAICHDERIQEAFDDGILWITLGQTPGDLTAKVNDLIEIIDGKRPGFTEIHSATYRLAELLVDRDILFIIDDVWNYAHLNPFLQGGRRCARLITTRNQGILPHKCKQIDLDAMNQQEARQLLGFGLPSVNISAIGELSRLLGKWPLLLKLVNGVLRNRVNNRGQSLRDAIEFVNKALKKIGLTAFDSQYPEDRNQAVNKTLRLSLDLLSNKEKARFAELAIFPEDVDIPLGAVKRLWQHANFDDVETEMLCIRLHNLSLLLNFDINIRQIRLHDVIHNYLMTQHSSELKAIHTEFLRAYGLQTWADLPVDEAYLWKHIAYHLVESGQTETLKSMLMDFSWLRKKLSVCDINSLLSDYDFFLEEAELRIVQSALRLSSNQLTYDLNQLPAHLLGRLMSNKSVRIQGLLEQGATERVGPWLRPLSFSLSPPGGSLNRTLVGHSHLITAIAISADGKRAISASPSVLNIWDLREGEVIHTFKNVGRNISALAISANGKYAISALGHIFKIWNLNTGQVLHSFKDDNHKITAVAISSDGKRAITASNNTFYVWNLNTGKILHSFKDDSSKITAIAISADGKRAISMSDFELKVWDLSAGIVLYALKDDANYSYYLAISADGKCAVSGLDGRAFKIWDMNTGDIIHTFKNYLPRFSAIAVNSDGTCVISVEGRIIKVWDLNIREVDPSPKDHHYGRVSTIAISADGKSAVSGCPVDNTLKAWDLCKGEVIRTIDGYSGSRREAAVWANGNHVILGSSSNGGLIAWDLSTGEVIYTLNDDSRYVYDTAISADGKRAITMSEFKLKVWDLSTGKVIQTLKSYNPSGSVIAITADGKRAISMSDFKLKVWDLSTGEVTTGEVPRPLSDYQRMIDFKISADGKQAISLSSLVFPECIIHVWDLGSGKVTHTFSNSDYISAIAISSNGKLVLSGSLDRTLKVWDLYSGEILHTLKGHYARISTIAISPEGKYAVSGSYDMNLIAWDMSTGKRIATFIGESEVTACAIVPGRNIIVSGEHSGKIHILHLEGIDNKYNVNELETAEGKQRGLNI